MKKISLNGHVRSEIVRRVMARWKESRYVAPINGLPTPEELRERDALRREEHDYRATLALALGTFRTVPELVEEWPEIEGYVPDYITDPRKAIRLPELP